MNISEYTNLLSKPESVNDRQTLALDQIVSEFPYFQSARALRLKGLYNQNSFQYNYALKVAAAFTTDRSVLFDFITSDTFTAIHKGLYEQKLAELYGIEVNGSEQVKIEIVDSGFNKVEQSILTSIKESEPNYREQSNQPVAQEAIELAKVENDLAVAEEISLDSEEQTRDFVDESVDELPAEPETSAPIDGDNLGNLSETSLEIGKPLEFSKDEKHSFQEWLQLSAVKPIDRNAPIEETPAVNDADVVETDGAKSGELEAEKAKHKTLIDQFIKANPKIPPVRNDVKPAVAEQPFREDTTALMTETLARVYLEQKKYQKAIQAYEILILKYPEKITFFADRISEVKNLQKNNTL